ncbi:UTRA domain protein [compost metagenome]
MERYEISFEQLIEPPQPIEIAIQRSGVIRGYGIAHSMMNLPKGAELFYFVRIYSLGDQPIGAAKVHVPISIRDSLHQRDMSERNIPRTIATRSGKVLGSCAFSVDSTLAEPRYAEMVGARAGAPLTSIRRTSHATDDTAIEHTHLLLRPDLVHLVSRRSFDHP